MSLSCLTPVAVVKALANPNSLDSACLAVLYAHTYPTQVSVLLYPLYFGLTCFLEAPAYLVSGRLLGRRYRELAVQTMVLNLATHPIVFWLFPWALGVLRWNMLSLLSVAETFAILVEAGLLVWWAGYPWLVGIAASVVANLTSWWLGALITG